MNIKGNSKVKNAEICQKAEHSHPCIPKQSNFALSTLLYLMNIYLHYTHMVICLFFTQKLYNYMMFKNKTKVINNWQYCKLRETELFVVTLFTLIILTCNKIK